jgi:hypothetical protein
MNAKGLADLSQFAEGVNQMTREELIGKMLPDVNALLPGCSAMGAYCLGMITASAISDYRTVPVDVLRLASLCTRPQDAAELYQEWRAGRSLEAYEG